MLIVVTGATGYIGRLLLARLVESGHRVRCIIRPSETSPRLPRDIPLQIAVTNLGDFRSIRAALVGAEQVIHLASAENSGSAEKMLQVDVDGTRRLLSAAQEVGVRRLLYLSHLGADAKSYFPLFQRKGQAEQLIQQSGVPFTIIRSALAFGAEDRFTNTLAAIAALSPGTFFLPGDGQIRLQPVWVEDLTACIEYTLEDTTLLNQTVSIGGPEYLSVQHICQLVMEQSGRVLRPTELAIPYLRWLTRRHHRRFPNAPVHSMFLDHFTVNRTCEIHNITRFFGVRATRMEHALQYLRPLKPRDARRWVRGK
ncbi:MAG TPA: NAD(P)H-binding protein [Anaerolineales bacterium]|nr:NAD(P)H-binding protein [Anaerolineales bacterium]